MRRILLIVLSGQLLAGCATTVPYTGRGPHRQIERGAPALPIDTLGNLLALPSKLLFWNRRFINHDISAETEEMLVAYLAARDLPALADVKFRLNQYHPAQDLKRLLRNSHVAWPYRLLLGLPVTLLSDVVLPGRLFPWGDYYNPFTHTVHLYSDVPAIALHEAGHVHDFGSRRFKGTYAAFRIIPFVDLFQEYKASGEAIAYLKETDNHAQELAAYKVLYPAYGSYLGSYIFPVIGSTVGVLAGHLVGRTQALFQRRSHARRAEARDPSPADTAEPATAPVPATP